MRTHAISRGRQLALVLVLALAGSLAQAQVALVLVLALAGSLAQAQVAAPPLPSVPPAKPDPTPPLSQVPVAPPETTPPAAAAHQAAEMARGEPLRWYTEDATEEQRLRTQRKEIGAAYEEAKLACKRVVKTERAQCLNDARATYEKELAAIDSKAGVR